MSEISSIKKPGGLEEHVSPHLSILDMPNAWYCTHLLAHMSEDISVGRRNSWLSSANRFSCIESASIGKSKLTPHGDVATPADLPKAQSLCGWHSGKCARATADILAPIILHCHRHRSLSLTPAGVANFIEI